MFRFPPIAALLEEPNQLLHRTLKGLGFHSYILHAGLCPENKTYSGTKTPHSTNISFPEKYAYFREPRVAPVLEPGRPEEARG